MQHIVKDVVHHCQLCLSYFTYDTRRARLPIIPHHPFHLQITTRKCPVHRNPSTGSGGDLVHLGIIVSIVTYVIIAPAHPWVNPTALGWDAPRGTEIDGGSTTAQLAAERARWEWEEAVITLPSEHGIMWRSKL
jgi:hypothetical protein